jgi:lysophospholipase L1-like esterase
VAAHGPADVIDMLEASRGSSLRTSSDFTEDGVHLSPTGNAALGKLIAARILRDARRRSDGD